MNHDELRKARQEAGIEHLERMADIIGMNKGNLSKVENGKCARTKLREVASLYELALGMDEYALWKRCGVYPDGVKKAASLYRHQRKEVLSTIGEHLRKHLHVTPAHPHHMPA